MIVQITINANIIAPAIAINRLFFTAAPTNRNMSANQKTHDNIFSIFNILFLIIRYRSTIQSHTHQSRIDYARQ